MSQPCCNDAARTICARIFSSDEVMLVENGDRRTAQESCHHTKMANVTLNHHGGSLHTHLLQEKGFCEMYRLAKHTTSDVYVQVTCHDAHLNTPSQSAVFAPLHRMCQYSCTQPMAIVIAYLP
jgi:hypothetical protein